MRGARGTDRTLCREPNIFISSSAQEGTFLDSNKLCVKENSFDFAWIDEIEEAGRQDWYEPLRRRMRIKS